MKKIIIIITSILVLALIIFMGSKIFNKADNNKNYDTYVCIFEDTYPNADGIYDGSTYVQKDVIVADGSVIKDYKQGNLVKCKDQEEYDKYIEKYKRKNKYFEEEGNLTIFLYTKPLESLEEGETFSSLESILNDLKNQRYTCTKK